MLHGEGRFARESMWPAARLALMTLAASALCCAAPRAGRSRAGNSAAQEQSAAAKLPAEGAAAVSAPESMSLAQAMKSIEAGLKGIGQIEFIAYATDDRGYTAMKRISHEWSEVTADAGTCRLSYRWRATSDGQMFQDSVHALSLKDVREIAVITGEQAFQSDLTQAGHRELKARVEPGVFVLEARRASEPGRRTVSDSFFFGDEESANRTAAALQRAVEMCGGGSKERQ